MKNCRDNCSRVPSACGDRKARCCTAAQKLSDLRSRGTINHSPRQGTDSICIVTHLTGQTKEGKTPPKKSRRARAKKQATKVFYARLQKAIDEVDWAKVKLPRNPSEKPMVTVLQLTLWTGVNSCAR